MSVAFETSLKDFSRHHPVWTGNPVRRAMLTGSRDVARSLFSLEADVPTLLVLGGGTGAAGLNAIVRGAAPLLSPTFQILHVTGKGKGDTAFAHQRYHAVEFLADGMAHAYAVADMVVTRAGIGTLTELAALALSTVIVPMPRSHQEENARFFADHGAAHVLDELGATSATLAECVLALWHDTERMSALSIGMRSLAKGDASTAVAEIVLSAAGRTKG
jgi:UDP-N-acetylglucosamine--N-acetylmuramyl-(pentapeptide) pyrophosphoryl-undecaprenol N-acetylglucosamine transferase